MDDGSASLQDQQRHAENEMATSKLLVGISSGASLLGALVMIGYFLVYQESRRCGRRLLFCLHVADAGAACAWLLVFVLPATEEGSSTSSTVCSVQGYFLVFFPLASCLWTGCFAFHLFQFLARRCKAPERYEHRYHLVAWGFPLATIAHLYVQALAGADLVGESGRPWCWIRSWSDEQWSKQGFYVQLTVFYAPVVLVFFHNLATYLMLLYLMPDSFSTSMETRIHYRLLFYSWAFFLSNLWTVFTFAYQTVAFDHALNAPLLYLTSFFTPLQGALNAIVYGMNNAFRERVYQSFARSCLPSR